MFDFILLILYNGVNNIKFNGFLLFFNVEMIMWFIFINLICGFLVEEKKNMFRNFSIFFVLFVLWGIFFLRLSYKKVFFFFK